MRGGKRRRERGKKLRGAKRRGLETGNEASREVETERKVRGPEKNDKVEENPSKRTLTYGKVDPLRPDDAIHGFLSRLTSDDFIQPGE